ncbi:hypothetical protein ACFX13_031161 [Malus domestica]
MERDTREKREELPWSWSRGSSSVKGKTEEGGLWRQKQLREDSVDLSINTNDNVNFVDNRTLHNFVKQKKLENDFDAFTASKVTDLAKPLKEVQIPYKIRFVKDHDMKERLCLEVERLGLSVVIMGS